MECGGWHGWTEVLNGKNERIFLHSLGDMEDEEDGKLLKGRKITITADIASIQVGLDVAAAVDDIVVGAEVQLVLSFASVLDSRVSELAPSRQCRLAHEQLQP